MIKSEISSPPAFSLQQVRRRRPCRSGVACTRDCPMRPSGPDTACVKDGTGCFLKTRRSILTMALERIRRSQEKHIGTRRMPKDPLPVSRFRKPVPGTITVRDGFRNSSCLAWADHGILSTVRFGKVLTAEMELKRKHLYTFFGTLKPNAG